MVVRLKLADGSERTVDVVTIEARLGATPVELSFEGEPVRLRVCAPGGWGAVAYVGDRPGGGERGDDRGGGASGIGRLTGE